MARPVQLGQRLMRQLEPQHDQRHYDPVDKHEIMVWAGACRTQEVVASAFGQRTVPQRRPRTGQPVDQIGQVAARAQPGASSRS